MSSWGASGTTRQRFASRDSSNLYDALGILSLFRRKVSNIQLALHRSLSTRCIISWVHVVHNEDVCIILEIGAKVLMFVTGNRQVEGIQLFAVLNCEIIDGYHFRGTLNTLYPTSTVHVHTWLRSA